MIYTYFSYMLMCMPAWARGVSILSLTKEASSSVRDRLVSNMMILKAECRVPKFC
jgi:hypothetical protein